MSTWHTKELLLFATLWMWPHWLALEFVSVWIITSRHVDACMTTLCSTNSTISFQSMIIFHRDERPTGATSGGGKHAPYNSERDAEYDNYCQCRCMGCAQYRVQRLVSMRVHGTCSIHCLHHLGCNDAWTYTDVWFHTFVWNSLDHRYPEAIGTNFSMSDYLAQEGCRTNIVR